MGQPPTNKSVELKEFLDLRYSAGGHPFTRHISQRLGAVLAWLAMKMRLSPNMVTSAAALTITLAGGIYAIHTAGWITTFTALILMQISYALDCADGQLARATGQASRRGAWWDVYCDFYAIVLVSTCVLIYMMHGSHIILTYMLPTVMFFTFCRCASLYSSTFARKSEEPGPAETSQKNIQRKLLTLALDTPFVLLCLCILREWPLVLCLYIAMISPVYLLHSLYVGLKSTRE